MSFMKLSGGNDLKEPTNAPEGEYALQITDTDSYVKDTGRGVMKVRIDFEDHDDYNSFNTWVVIPNQKIDIDDNPKGAEEGQKQFNRMLLGVKRFCAQWSVPFDDGYNEEDFLGARCVGKVYEQERDGSPGTYDQRLVTPRLAE